ncbi:hypothetical protein I316_01362 [Kwoniella heveanensis BCC8398]|uniref:Ig-like domain-containing protein n=1 Tax=Kwoniella heveanensis BCC8398 TaxID=1296120 RepID=A0A1B9H0F9_9TREE|nr:hypothetical protein I316_01362 [Kwoniella heveanensis BCC8398]
MRLPLFAAAQVQALLASSEASSSSSASLSIQGPSTLLSCTPATYTWTATSGPYTLSIQDHSSTASSVDAPETISENLVIVSSGESATWIVDVRPGVNVSVSIVDGQGNKAQSEVVFVSEGSLECLD